MSKDKKIFYNVSPLAYLPTLMGRKVFGATIDRKFRCTERIIKVLLRQGEKLEDIEKRLPEELKQKRKYLKDVHYYFWVTNSLKYALKKVKREQKRIVYLDNLFSKFGEKSSSILYVFPETIIDKFNFYPEGNSKHKTTLRKLRSAIFNINFMTPDKIPLNYAQAAIINERDLEKTSTYLHENKILLPLISVKNLLNITRKKDLGKKIREILTR